MEVQVGPADRSWDNPALRSSVAAAIRFDPLDDPADLAIRFASFLSVVGSTYLLIHVYRMRSKTVLSKQLMHLAAVDIVAFSWEMLTPYDLPCRWHDKVWKFFLALSIATELAIAIGMLVTVLRWQWLLRHGGLATLLVWPVVGVCYFWYVAVAGISDGPNWHPEVKFCVGTQFQVDMEFVYGWAVFFTILLLYGISSAFLRRQRSPDGVVEANFACAKWFLVGYMVVNFPYGIFLVHVHLAIRPNNDGKQEWPYLAILDRNYYIVGHLTMCLNGVVNALVYSMHRLRGRGEGNTSSFAVGFESEDQVFSMTNMTRQARDTAEEEIAALEQMRPTNTFTSQSGTGAQLEKRLREASDLAGVQFALDKRPETETGGETSGRGRRQSFGPADPEFAAKMYRDKLKARSQSMDAAVVSGSQPSGSQTQEKEQTAPAPKPQEEEQTAPATKPHEKEQQVSSSSFEVEHVPPVQTNHGDGERPPFWDESVTESSPTSSSLSDSGRGWKKLGFPRPLSKERKQEGEA